MKVIGDIAEYFMLGFTGFFVKHKKAGGISRLRGSLGYQLLRKLIKKISCCERCIGKLICYHFQSSFGNFENLIRNYYITHYITYLF